MQGTLKSVVNIIRHEGGSEADDEGMLAGFSVDVIFLVLVFVMSGLSFLLCYLCVSRLMAMAKPSDSQRFPFCLTRLRNII